VRRSLSVLTLVCLAMGATGCQQLGESATPRTGLECGEPDEVELGLPALDVPAHFTTTSAVDVIQVEPDPRAGFGVTPGSRGCMHSAAPRTRHSGESALVAPSALVKREIPPRVLPGRDLATSHDLIRQDPWLGWRWRRDLNPRWTCAHKRFRGVLLRPLGHATAGKVTGGAGSPEIGRAERDQATQSGLRPVAPSSRSSSGASAGTATGGPNRPPSSSAGASKAATNSRQAATAAPSAG
jgi:hypothetical protein